MQCSRLVTQTTQTTAPDSPDLGRAPVGRAPRGLRRDLPRRPGRVHGRHVAALHRGRPRRLALLSAVGRHRLRARVRRTAAARRPDRRPARPPPGLPDRAGRLRRGLDARARWSPTPNCSSRPGSSRASPPRSPRRPRSRSSPPPSTRARTATARSASSPTCAASGFSMGLILGGLLTEVGWRWTFLLPGPVALIVLLFARQADPEQPARRRPPAGTTYRVRSRSPPAC